MRETDPRTSDLCSLLGACMYRTRYQVCFSLFSSSSGGWVKIKLELPHFHLCIRYVSCFDSTHSPVATAARAAATGLVSMSTRPDIPGMLHLEREARDWSTYNEYSTSIIRAKRVSNCYIPKQKFVHGACVVCSTNLGFSVGVRITYHIRCLLYTSPSPRDS